MTLSSAMTEASQKTHPEIGLPGGPDIALQYRFSSTEEPASARNALRHRFSDQSLLCHLFRVQWQAGNPARGLMRAKHKQSTVRGVHAMRIPTLRSLITGLAVVAVSALVASPALAQKTKITVYTALENDQLGPYKQAFETANPDV